MDRGRLRQLAILFISVVRRRVETTESDHSIVAATIRLRGRFAPNRPKRPANRHPRINRQILVNNGDIRRDFARAIDNGLRESPVSPTGLPRRF